MKAKIANKVSDANKTLHVKMISKEGHTDVYLDPATAVEELNQMAKTQWGYLDGQLIADWRDVNLTALNDEADITFTNRLAGGNVQ